jgi:hypothetical protein
LYPVSGRLTSPNRKNATSGAAAEDGILRF